VKSVKSVLIFAQQPLWKQSNHILFLCFSFFNWLSIFELSQNELLVVIAGILCKPDAFAVAHMLLIKESYRALEVLCIVFHTGHSSENSNDWEEVLGPLLVAQGFHSTLFASRLKIQVFKKAPTTGLYWF